LINFDNDLFFDQKIEKKRRSYGNALTSGNSFEFYSTGKAPTKETACKWVKSARERVEAGIPFTRFPVLDMEDRVIGEFAIGFNDDPTKLEIAGRGLAEQQHQGIGTELITWLFQTYLPDLHKNGVQLSVFEEGQGDAAWKDKKVKHWPDLEKVMVVATVHSDHKYCIDNYSGRRGLSK